MCALRTDPAAIASRLTRIHGGRKEFADRPIRQEFLAEVSQSNTCPEEDFRLGDSSLNSYMLRRDPSKRLRTGHHAASLRERSETKTTGEMEAAVCQGMSRFEQDYMGRGPRDIRAHLLGDLLVVRLQGFLTAAEQHLAALPLAEKGRDLLKQTRTHLIETARSVLEAMVREATGVNVLSMHHDISTVTGEKVIVFTLATPPTCRSAKKQSRG